MALRPTITTAIARLVTLRDTSSRARCFRPLVAGAALLRREPGAATWTVELQSDRMLRPRAPGRSGTLVRPARGAVCRIGAALAGPLDAVPTRGRTAAADDQADTPRRLRLDFYGWALMYQPPGLHRRALVDADDRFEDLPAVFELPLELIDRAEFLESRGFRTRPLVIPTQPGDFEPGPDGRLRNRYFPDASFRPPRGLDRLF